MYLHFNRIIIEHKLIIICIDFSTGWKQQIMKKSKQNCLRKYGIFKQFMIPVVAFLLY